MKKIGIVTSARELNYGAILQAYALQCVTQEMGYDSSLIWWSNQKNSHRDIRFRKLFGMAWKYLMHPSIFLKSFRTYHESFKKEMSEEIISNFQKFEDERLKIKFLSYNQMKKFAYATNCKAVIAGSDQIWNSYAIYVDPFYYLRFAPKSKRIAYAPSLGKSNVASYNKKEMKRYIEDFPVLSIREKSGKEQLEKFIDRSIEVVADPSLLFTKENWNAVRTNIKTPEHFLLLYFLDEPNDSCLKIIKKKIALLGLPVIAFPYHFEKFLKMNELHFMEPGPAEFLDLIAKADFVLTDSFHGTAFSINFNKPFYTFDRQYGNNQSQSSRLADFLSEYGLSDRFIKDENIELDLSAIIDYEKVNEKLETNRKKSLEFLKNAIHTIEE